jgi:FtsH-binding integral membrane protein
MDDGHEGLLNQNNGLDKFTDRDIRMGFIKKVYTLMSIQLLVTAIFVVVACNFLNDWINKDPNFVVGVLIACVVGYLATAIPLLCCKLGRVVPINYILLTIFTLCLSTLVGFCAAAYDGETVTAAAVCTLGVTIGITVYACTTKSDFTVFGPILFVVGFAFVFICPLFFIFTHKLRVLWAFFGVILFSFYLLFDTQLIMGGKRYEIGIDDYIMAAMILYLDIINIFLELLRLFGNK